MLALLKQNVSFFCKPKPLFSCVGLKTAEGHLLSEIIAQPSLWPSLAPGLFSLVEESCSCCSLAVSSDLLRPRAQNHGAWPSD